jgi:hypothetical protein
MLMTREIVDDMRRIAVQCQEDAGRAYAGAREAMEHGAPAAARELQRRAHSDHGAATLWLRTVARNTVSLRLALQALGAWLRWTPHMV